MPAQPASLELPALRAQFPGLARTVAGRQAAFLDGPAGSQIPESVIIAMGRVMRDLAANTGGEFITSRKIDELVESARETAADFLGGTAREVAFGPNMTTLSFQLAHAVARTLAKGDEIVVTDLDHDANISPWLTVARDRELVVRRAPIRAADGTLDLDRLESLLGPRTKVVAFTLASNALGTVPPARRIVDAAHRVGALAVADAVHFAPHRRLDRKALGADAVLCSPYKFFGPHAGLLSIREDLAATLPVDRVRPASEDPPGHRFETGTPSFEALAGICAAIEYIAALGAGASRRERLDSAFSRIEAHETALSRRALARAAELPGARVHGITEPSRLAERTPTFCMTFPGRTAHSVSAALGERGVFTWWGHYYAIAVMEALQLQSSGGGLRAGFLHYNTLEEVDRLFEELEAILR